MAELRALLAGGADPKQADADSASALHHAAAAGCVEALGALLDAGAAIDARDRSGRTPAARAIGAQFGPGNPAALAVLLARGANPDQAIASGIVLLQQAAMLGSEEMVRALLERGAAIDRSDEHGETALMDAARDGNSAVLRLLLARDWCQPCGTCGSLRPRRN